MTASSDAWVKAKQFMFAPFTDCHLTGTYLQILDTLSPMEIAHTLVISAARGQVDILRECCRRLEGIPVEIEYRQERRQSLAWYVTPMGAQKIHNGEIDHNLGSLRSPMELKEILGLLRRRGSELSINSPWCTFLFGRSADNLAHHAPMDSRHLARGISLPVVRDGGVGTVEALDVLLDLSQGADWGYYEPMLCWATPEMIQRYPESLLPYQKVFSGRLLPGVVLEGTYHDGGYDFLPMARLEEAGASEGDREGLPFEKWCQKAVESFTYIHCGVQCIGRDQDVVDCLLFDTFIPDLVRIGFNWPVGLTLCRTALSFLGGLGRLEGTTSEGTSEGATGLINYFPVCMTACRLVPALGNDLVKQDRFRLKDTHDTVERFLTSFYWNDAPVEFSRPKMPQVVLQSMVNRVIQQELSVSDVISLKKFGVDLSGAIAQVDSVLLGYNDFDNRQDGLPVFASLEVMTNDAEDRIQDLIQIGCLAVSKADGPILINGVPSTTGPLRVLRGLCSHERPVKPHLAGACSWIGYASVALHLGPEELLSVVAVEEDWRQLLAVFGAGPLLDYHDQVPEDVLTQLAADVLDF
ncbi:hypothetical protein HNP46_000523 [Pseudomonas nitritireducens]|uniref:Uncharacterized protein n=1 Tax=Pseudomonas nitroreducens TaxID=46680 RepID=A0A7W7NZY7_PSENT|nr:hypothetical protein [Pseudomonas nitritireducens]MBB4861712.1 hypothetical protein [Pseudomonas nitritireducens]